MRKIYKTMSFKWLLVWLIVQNNEQNYRLVSMESNKMTTCVVHMYVSDWVKPSR